MGFRFRFFGFHLLASLCVLTLVTGVFYLGWYGWPGWYLLGADKLVGILVLVDVGLGPLATLVVSNPEKKRNELRRDITLIVLIQVAALGYGMGTLWKGRPLFYSFSLDRIEVVPAVALDEKSCEAARQQGARIVPSWTSVPQWIWAPLPDDPEERDRIITSALNGGPDVVAMPQYYRPIKEGLASMRANFKPIGVLAGSQGLSEPDYQVLISELGRPESDLGVLPVQGRSRDGAWVFDRNSGEPLAFQPVVIWHTRK